MYKYHLAFSLTWRIRYVRLIEVATVAHAIMMLYMMVRLTGVLA